MIDINLVPPELRKRRRSSSSGLGLDIPIEILIGSAGGLLVLLVGIHLILMTNYMLKAKTLKKLDKAWSLLEKDKANVDVVINRMRALQGQYNDIANISQQQRFPWAPKLNSLSNILPRGVWLRRLALKEDVFLIEGSSLSKASEEMINVHGYISKLKEDEIFMKDFIDIEPGPIQTKNINNVDIANFLITAKPQSSANTAPTK